MGKYSSPLWFRAFNTAKTVSMKGCRKKFNAHFTSNTLSCNSSAVLGKITILSAS
jgi:hypothetical protein